MTDATITLRAAIDCSICRRTLLRGEHADVFRHRGALRLVCELCTAAALRRRWVPEGAEEELAPRVRWRLVPRLRPHGRPRAAHRCAIAE